MSININDCCGDGIDNSSTACGCLGDGFVEQRQPQVYQPNNSGNLPGGTYVLTVNTIPGPYVTLTTTNIPEGTNLYFTNARVYSLFNATAPILFNNSTGNISMQTSGVTAGTYGSATQYSAFTVDIYGRITSTQLFPLPSPVSLGPNLLAIQAISPANTGILTDLGNGTWVTRNLLPAADNSVSVSSYLTGDVTIGLPNSGVTAGTYGNNTSTLTAIVNGKGVLTALTSVPINFPASQTPNFWQIPGVNANVQYNQSTNPIPQGTTLTYDTASNTWGNFGQSGGIKQVYSNSVLFNGLGTTGSVLDLNVVNNLRFTGLNQYNAYYSYFGYVFILLTSNVVTTYNVLAVSKNNGQSFFYIDLSQINISAGIFGSMAVREDASAFKLIFATAFNYNGSVSTQKIYTLNISFTNDSGYVITPIVPMTNGLLSILATNESIVQMKYLYREDSGTGARIYLNKIAITTVTFSVPLATHILKFYLLDDTNNTGTVTYNTTIYNSTRQSAFYYFDFDKSTGTNIAISGTLLSDASQATVLFTPNFTVYFSSNSGNTFSTITTNTVNSNQIVVDSVCISTNLIMIGANISTAISQYSSLFFTAPVQASPTFTDNTTLLPAYISTPPSSTNDLIQLYKTVDVFYISQNKMLLHIIGNGYQGGNGASAHAIFDYSAGGTITSSMFSKLLPNSNNNYGFFDYDYGLTGSDYGNFIICSSLGTGALNFTFIDWESYIQDNAITEFYFIRTTSPKSSRNFLLTTGITDAYISSLDYLKLFNAPIQSINTTTPISVSGTNVYLNVDQNGQLKLSLTAQT